MALENILYGELVELHTTRACLTLLFSARAFNSEHQVKRCRARSYCSLIHIFQMELINECSLRFAEDKDFRLLVFCAYFYPH